jgi:NitT/TauT family transport system substrate-binding protein
MRTRAAVCCVLLLLVAGAGGAAPAAGPAQVPTPVRIAVLPFEPTALAFYAHHRGFFRRQGIEAQITTLADPAQIPAALLSGQAQFVGSTVGALAILRSRGAPVRLAAAGALYRRQAPTAALVAAPGKRIAGARDLVGRRVGIDQANTIAHVALLKWLRSNGRSADDVRLTEIPFPLMLGPLLRGTIDAAVLPEPFLTQALQRGARRVANTTHAVCAQDCLLTLWMTRRDVDANLTARFRNAIQAAAVWANRKENDAASGAILARYAPIDARVIRAMTRTRFAQRLRPAQAQPWIDVFAEYGVIPASFSALDLVE